jgi:hypothetical protein
VEGTRFVCRRDACWDGTAIVTDEAALLQSRLGRRDFDTETDRLVLSRGDFEAVSEAIARPGVADARSVTDPTAAAKVRGRLAGLVEATGNLASQVHRLTGARAQRSDMFTRTETHLDAGLSTLWTQDQLRELWAVCDSGRLMPADGVLGPGPDGYFGRDQELATAARDLLKEVTEEQRRFIRELSKPVRSAIREWTELQGLAVPERPEDIARETAADHSGTADRLIRVAPDYRWQAIVRRLPLGDTLNQGDLRSVALNLRIGFNRAMRLDNPGAGTPQSAVAAAVRQAAADVRIKVMAAGGNQQAAAIAMDGVAPARGAVGIQDGRTQPASPGTGEQPATLRLPDTNRPQAPGLGG